MIRNVITIDAEKCVGCGLCVNACHEGAIGMVNGKATLLRDDYCDGLGNCLPVCPTKAITFEKREAQIYNKEVAPKRLVKKEENLACGCPGTHSKKIERIVEDVKEQSTIENNSQVSMLNQWPVQIKLVPALAPYFENANLLIAADCSAYAYANFHKEFIKNKITIIGCPKLDEGDYTDKLTAIIKNNNIKSVTVIRMEVPCCSGIATSAIQALKNSEKMIPWNIVTISTDGKILE